MYVTYSICIITFVYKHLCFLIKRDLALIPPQGPQVLVLQGTSAAPKRPRQVLRLSESHGKVMGKSWESHGNCGKLWEGMEDKMWKICKPMEI